MLPKKVVLRMSMAQSAAYRVFIASTTRSLDVARAFQSHFYAQDIEAKVWHDPGEIGPGLPLITALIGASLEFTHAVIIFSQDDLTPAPGKTQARPRDNLLFEAGLFAGQVGIESVYIAIPKQLPTELPSDLDGVTCVVYTPGPNLEVGAACNNIISAMQKRGVTNTSLRFGSNRRGGGDTFFWDVLSDPIVVVFGVEDESDLKHHPRMSLHDLQAASHVYDYLTRRYPHKKIYNCPSSPSFHWRSLLEEGGDLVVVGGFVTNREFQKHHSQFEAHTRLKMGRVCSIDDQMVYHLDLWNSRGIALPGMHEPEKLEDLPAKYVKKDFAAVTNSRVSLHGRHRRVITIAGIKGNGTQGAAIFLTREVETLSRFFTKSVGHADMIELVVSTETDEGMIDAMHLEEVILNGQGLFRRQNISSTKCELNRPCLGCDWGLNRLQPQQTLRSEPQFPTRQLSRCRKLIFDLDDTIVPTFDALIRGLEVIAARKMRESGFCEISETELADTLIDLRRTHPHDIEEELQRRLPTVKIEALEARRFILDERNIDLGVLKVSGDVKALLYDLKPNHSLGLITTGDPTYQTRKLEHLGIGANIFSDIRIVDRKAGEDKLRTLVELIGTDQRQPAEYAVIGNRLDDEIQAARSLGMTTVWVRSGEGSCMFSESSASKMADFQVSDVLQIRGLFLHGGAAR